MMQSLKMIDIAAYNHIFNLNVLGPLIAMQQVIPIMRAQGRGMISNICSGTALIYLSGMGAYSSVKRVLSGISLTPREELKDDNIIVNLVYPYITFTD